ncbi:lytic murein transglycosylase [Corallincola spongiicola]|uniref:Lytic murein transglycosylase n=1 Tax=Corallincola spongiicola TaxID=2520508 RepID=A0ABY1WV16_9GAMM|nr:lytic murein transglycosylase [Corallincola spongiicola]TAA48605.1 lytic murein transglycosylase [Corallincola spongiicola]
MMSVSRSISLLFLVVISLTTLNVAANQAAPEGFDGFIEQMKQQAADEGIKPEIIAAAFADVTFMRRAVKQDKAQPEFKKSTLDTYMAKRVPDWKVKKARELYKKHRRVLDKIGSEYGVQPRFIVALWGSESNFGSYQGNFPVVSALSTMAFEGRRAEFFRKELMNALFILDQGHISIDKFKGSWAGAMGQTQFMPSSFLSFAVDYNGDGKKDIWGSEEDAFASIANYLSQSGWDDSLTWGRQVKVPQTIDTAVAGIKTKYTLAEWQAKGVRRYDGSDLPVNPIQASLIIPDDTDGRVFLAYSNFDVLMRWNRSYYFACTVGYLSDRIRYPSL